MRPAELKNIRIKAHLTQREMADQLGITRPALTQYETGARSIPLYIMKLVNELFQGNNANDISKQKIDLKNENERLRKENETLKIALSKIRSITVQFDNT